MRQFFMAVGCAEERSFRILLTPLTYIHVGEAHRSRGDALRKLSTSYGTERPEK